MPARDSKQRLKKELRVLKAEFPNQLCLKLALRADFSVPLSLWLVLLRESINHRGTEAQRRASPVTFEETQIFLEPIG